LKKEEGNICLARWIKLNLIRKSKTKYEKKEKKRIEKKNRKGVFEPPLDEAEQPPSVWRCSVTLVKFRGGWATSNA